MTRQVAGVQKIYNYIEVGANETASQSSKDAYLTSAVKSNMVFPKGLAPTMLR